ncbi:hypothetical protein [Marinobacter sp.]|uniref:hypothetical protein n=1 Tax=Marinobacter sp. TaxID=50741 RepID=UPI000C8A32DA|nr:hypothetical protein [Marinobacter sp.]MAB51342.1 hypothetical protein [Marinobacter sp.]MAB51385.1 hypothetical protein [Marinobacter sp.]
MDQFRGAYQQGLLAEGVDPNSFDPYGLAATGLLFAPGAGVADAAGYAPSMTTAGEYEPSMMANIGGGRYMDAGLQGLGLLGDAFMAAGTVVPPLIPVGAAMKAPRAARLAGRMSEDVSGTLLMQQPKKRPQIRQMPQAEQDLYEAAAAFQLPRDVGEGLLLPQRAYEYGARTAEVGNQGLLVDPGFQNLGRDLPIIGDNGTVVRDLKTLAESPTVDLQKLIGRTAKLMPGDMTMAGKEITHVMGVKLKNPVRMRGGKDFSAEELSRELGVVWASDPAVISGYAKQAKENPGLVGVYTAMGGRGGDFSHHVADVIVDMTKQAKKWLPESKVADFNEQIKNMKIRKFDPETGKETISTPFTDFPGITSPKIEKYMYSPGKGAARKAIADTMEKSSFRDAGFPDVTAIRQIVSDPSMSSRVNDPSAMLAPTGGRIVEFDENPMLLMSGEGNIPEFHKTYRQAITGNDLGGLSIPVPRILMTPDFFAARRAGGKAPSSDRRSAEISNVLQVIRPEIADDVDVFQDYFNRGLLGRGF